MTTTTETTTQATETTRKGKAKDRKCHINDQGVLTLTIDGKEFLYWVDRLPSDYGVAFSLRKFVAFGPETYSVCIDTEPRGKADICDCLGHQRHGRCKHASALRAIIAAGRLPKYLTR